jgi:hypothetical protein
MQFAQIDKAYNDASARWSEAASAMHGLASQTIQAVEDGRLPVTLMRAYAEAHASYAAHWTARETARVAWETEWEAAARLWAPQERAALDAALQARQESEDAVASAHETRKAKFEESMEARKALLSAALTDPEGAEPLAEAYRQSLLVIEDTDAVLRAAYAVRERASHDTIAAQNAFNKARNRDSHRFEKENCISPPLSILE